MIDEMKPTLRTVMNRIKEVFGYKVDPFIINMLIESIKGNDLPKIPTQHIGKTLKKSIQEENGHFVFHNSDLKNVRTAGDIDDQSFEVVHEEDLNSGVSSIYFTDEPQWTSFDCDSYESSETDESSKCLEDFIHSYFSQNNQSIFSEDIFPTSYQAEASTSADEDSENGIQGGKYGFAIFLKHSGPAALQKLSLGKICQLVQHAIDQKLLNYRKTQLFYC